MRAAVGFATLLVCAYSHVAAAQAPTPKNAVQKIDIRGVELGMPAPQLNIILRECNAGIDRAIGVRPTRYYATCPDGRFFIDIAPISQVVVQVEFAFNSGSIGNDMIRAVEEQYQVELSCINDDWPADRCLQVPGEIVFGGTSGDLSVSLEIAGGYRYLTRVLGGDLENYRLKISSESLLLQSMVEAQQLRLEAIPDAPRF